MAIIEKRPDLGVHFIVGRIKNCFGKHETILDEDGNPVNFMPGDISTNPPPKDYDKALLDKLRKIETL